MASKQKPRYAPRNPIVRSSVQHRGGVHKVKKLRQSINAVDLLEEMDNWREELAFERSLKDRSNSPPHFWVCMNLLIRRKGKQLRTPAYLCLKVAQLTPNLQ